MSKQTVGKIEQLTTNPTNPTPCGQSGFNCSVAEKVQADDFVCLDVGGNKMYNCPACSGTDLMTWFTFCPNCGVKIEFAL